MSPEQTLADRVIQAIDHHTESLRLNGASTSLHATHFKDCTSAECKVANMALARYCGWIRGAWLPDGHGPATLVQVVDDSGR